MTTIGEWAFAYTTQLASVTIPDSVTSIGMYAFAYAASLTSLTIPNSVTSIRPATFQGSGLRSITIPNSVTSIGSVAFAFSSLESITIPNGVTEIGVFLFNGASSLKSITIPSSVTGILDYAFANTTSLRSITIPNSVTSIGYAAFENSGLRSITIPNSVTSIGPSAFNNSFNTSPLTTYTYCGAADLTNTGLIGKERSSCTTVPGAPIIGAATATGSTTATVSFTAPASSGGSTILSYTATSNPGNITATITQAGSGTISLTGLSPATPYTFTVTATNAIGTSLASAASGSITTLTTPGAPTIGTATSTGATTASVSFTAPASNGGATITRYTATSSPGGITGSISQAGSGTISVTGLSPATSYTFTITALNSVGASSASFASNSITTSTTAPGAPTIGTVTATGKRTATVDFTAPASNGGSVVTSYTAISTPGGVTKNLTQAGGGTFTFDGLQPGTSYTFAVTATNANGTSAAATSSSIKTTAPDVATLTSISFTDDGTGTGGKLAWVGSNIDLVRYTGPVASYPSPLTFGGYSASWNGNIRNLTPDTSYTISIDAISADGFGESKSLTFKTGAKSDAVKDLAYWNSWLASNTYFNGEASRLYGLLSKFSLLETSPHRSFIKVPISRLSTVTATSLTPQSCSVVSTTAKVDAGMVKAITKDKCTISYTVSGPSKAPVTMVKDFIFKKVG
ncbi:MAG: fibronectin type III domain-containing protein [Actinobacteria bacterium]|nr:fibronectin type III domain-containing protein [Actinomycetota bacterium]